MSETDEANEHSKIPSTDPQEISEVRAKIIGMLMQHFYEDGKDVLTKKEFMSILMKAGIVKGMVSSNKKE